MSEGCARFAAAALLRPARTLDIGGWVAEQVVLCERDGTSVLHGALVELWHKQLVVGAAVGEGEGGCLLGVSASPLLAMCVPRACACT